MNRFYNHIKRLVDTNDEVYSNSNACGGRWVILIQAGNHDANQLDGKQRHTGFDYYEYDMPKFTSATPGWAQHFLDRSRFNFQDHLEDLEHDQARHQSIHDHGCSQSC